MTKKEEGDTLGRCLALIEQLLGWGDSGKWTNYDFEKLSEEINVVTNVRLSVTTLKRIWGKLKYESAPTLTTLNTLARFAGYADWRTFGQVEMDFTASNSTEKSGRAIVPSIPANPKKIRYYWLLILIPLLALGYALIPSEKKIPLAKVDSNLFTFKADKLVTEGVPNSVVFHYNAKAAKTDSVFIVQTWDITRKEKVPKNKNAHSAIYYYPGFFRAKLIADNQVVKTHDLWITSNGWLCLAEGEPMPLYFKKEEFLQNGSVEVNADILKYNLALYPKPPRIRIFNQRDLGNLMSDTFTFETQVKNDFDGGTNACQSVQVLIQCKNDIIIIPLAAKACAGSLSMAFCGTTIDSKNADLSKFGADLTQWTKLRIETVNKKAKIYVNGQQAYSLDFPHDATGIVGVQYRFNGTGAVKDTWFESNGKEVRL